MADINQIGNNIRALREKNGMTQRALSDGVLVSFQAISAWERGLSVPDLENAVRLADFFGVSLDALLTPLGQEYYVGIDGDSDRTEFVLFEPNGVVKRVERLSGANPNHNDLNYTIALLTRGLEQLLVDLMPTAIFVGIAGVAQADYRKMIAARLSERFHAPVRVELDAANVLSMGTDPEDAMAVVCGSGSCVLVRKGNQQYHYGGWGQLFDQAGSAYDVGKDAIRCTLAAEDGLIPHNAMTQQVLRILGGGAFDNLSTIYQKGNSYIASFSTAVLEQAQAGESCAQQILQDNAKRLALLVKTAVQRHGMPRQIVASGSLLQQEMFRELVQGAAGVVFTMPDIPPVYGACVEALRTQGNSIGQQFHQNFLDSYKIY